MTEKIEEVRKMLLDHIRRLASEKNITHQDIADKSGLQQTHVTRMLAGRYSPTLDNFIRLAEAANCYLFVLDKNADDDLAETMRKRWDRDGQGN